MDISWVPQCVAMLVRESTVLVLFVDKMSVASSANRLAILFAQFNYSSVKLTKPLIVLNPSLGYEESVVTNRLNLKVVVEVDDPKSSSAFSK